MRTVNPIGPLTLGRIAAAAAVVVAGVAGTGWYVARADAVRAAAETAAMAANLGISDAPPAPGEAVDIHFLAKAGKTTIVDFYSAYCGPCMALKPFLESLAERRHDIVVVPVDINRPGVKGIDWGSPVAREYHLGSIPHLAVFGPDRALLAEDSPDDPAARRLVDGFLNN